MNITPNFKMIEFACKDGTKVPEDYEDNVLQLAKNLEVLRAHLNASIHINSGYRSISHNKRIGGKANSMHLLAKAADITVNGYTPKQVFKTIEKLIAEGKMDEGGLACYPSFVHYDCRMIKARW